MEKDSAKVEEKKEGKQKKDENLSVMKEPLACSTEQREPIANIFSKNTSKREEIVDDHKEYQGKHEETLSKQEALETTLQRPKQNIGDYLVSSNVDEHIIPKILDNDYMNKKFAMETCNDNSSRRQSTQAQPKHKKNLTKRNSHQSVNQLKRTKNNEDPRRKKSRPNQNNINHQPNKVSENDQKVKPKGWFKRFKSAVGSYFTSEDNKKQNNLQREEDLRRQASGSKKLKPRESPYIVLEQHGIQIVNNFVAGVFNDAIMQGEKSYQELLIEFLESTNMQNLTRKLLDTNEKIPDLLVGTRKYLSLLSKVKLVEDKAKQVLKECMSWYYEVLDNLYPEDQLACVDKILKLLKEKEGSKKIEGLLELFCNPESKHMTQNAQALFKFCIFVCPKNVWDLLKLRRSEIGLIKKEIHRQEKKKKLMIKEREECLKMNNEDDTYEFIGKLSQGGDVQMQLMIEYLVKNRLSFAQIKKELRKCNLDINNNVLSSHYIMSCVETINKHTWDVQRTPYVVLGNIGCGKSSLIQYLNKNLKTETVQSDYQWNVDMKNRKVGPIISNSLSNAETVVPQKYCLKDIKARPIIYDTPGFNIPDSYEQEIASCLSLQKVLNNNEKCKLIPCFSIYELQGRGFLFHKFCEQLSRILNLPKVSDEEPDYNRDIYEWPSMYVVTKIDMTRRKNVIIMLKRFAKEAPRHKVLISDICEKLQVFPKPVNGNFIGNLPKFIPLLSKLRPIKLNSELPISDGAKNKMRVLLDVWDTVLKEQLDKVFDEIIEPIVYESSLNYDIEFLKSFETIKEIEDIPDFFLKIGAPSDSDTESDKIKKDIYIIIATTLGAIIPYRDILIKLSGKQESGIFEAYLLNMIKKYLTEAKHILFIDYLINLKSLNLEVSSFVRSEYEISDENIGNLKGLVKYTINNEESCIEFLKTKMGLQDLIGTINSRKEKLSQFNYDQSKHYKDIINDILKNLKERISIAKTFLNKNTIIDGQRQTISKQTLQINKLEEENRQKDATIQEQKNTIRNCEETIENQKKELIKKDKEIEKIENEKQEMTNELNHYKKQVQKYNSEKQAKGLGSKLGSWFGKAISGTAGFVTGFFSGAASEINVENFKSGYRKGKDCGAAITKMAIEAGAAGVGAISGICKGVKDAEVKKAFNEGEEKGKEIGKKFTEEAVKLAGMGLGALKGVRDAEYKKAAAKGVKEGAEMAKNAIESAISNASKCAGVFVGLCQTEVTKSLKEGYDAGKELGKGIGNTIATGIGAAAGVAKGLTEAEYSKNFKKGVEHGETVGKAVGESAAYLAGGAAGTAKGLVTADYSGNFKKGLDDGEKAGKAVGEGAAYLVGGTAGVAKGLATADYAGAAKDGYKDGVENGENMGKAIGRAAGQTVGFVQGGMQGLQEGYEEGHKEGYEKGKELGGEIGKFVGDKVGKVHGFCDGMGEEFGDAYAKGKETGKKMGKEFAKNNPYLKCIAGPLGTVVGAVEGFVEGGKEMFDEARREGNQRGRDYIKNLKVAKTLQKVVEAGAQIEGALDEGMKQINDVKNTMKRVENKIDNTVKIVTEAPEKIQKYCENIVTDKCNQYKKEFKNSTKKAVKGFDKMLNTNYTKEIGQSVKEGFEEGIEESKQEYIKDRSRSAKNNDDNYLCALFEEKFSLGVSDKTDIKDMESVKNLKFEGKSLDLLLIEATRGFTSANVSYLWKSKRATKHGEIKKVAYHCFDFNISGKDQAKNFLSLLDTDHQHFKRGSDYSAVYIDYELYLEACRSQGSSTPDIIEEQLQDFMDDVNLEGYIEPIIMLSQGFIKIMDEDLVKKLGKLLNKPCSEEKKEIATYKEHFKLNIQETPIEEFATLFEVKTDCTFKTIKGTACCYIRLKDLPQEEPESMLTQEEINEERKKWRIFKPYMHDEIDKPFKNFNSLQKFYGIDVSTHQKEIDWEKVKDHKIHNRELAFVFIRATNGLQDHDEYYEDNINGVKDLNLKLKCAYHFFWVSRDIKKQARKFKTLIEESGEFNKEKDWIALDIELPLCIVKKNKKYYRENYKEDIKKYEKIKPDEWVKKVKEFMTWMGDEGYENKIIYMNSGFWEEHFLKAENPEEIFKDCLLWITFLEQRPGRIEKLWDHYRLPKCKNASFVQFCEYEKIDGIQGNNGEVDINLVSDQFAIENNW
ncbi:unnamed protein product [Moneuplotes crassus]|uniref:Uncharacterized protein n=1 Tax=Euplotes crassus TaxID=5936 RepID=A0AAD2D0W1_EUPCR|nr:unnamed protein product [Moneuplotes crassus]